MNEQMLSSPAALLGGAFLLDLAIGDPRWLPHPVVLMGKMISRGEQLLKSGDRRQDFFSGMFLSVIVIGLAALSAQTLVVLCYLLPSWLAFIAITALGSTTLATRGLLDAIKCIEAPLRAGDLVGAREKLSHIVGREITGLNRDKVMCASLESLSESTCDGIVAPLFYLSIGGVPLAMAFKAVSTLDSMIGYRTEKYLYFGKFAARLDDALNFIPARLTALFLILAAMILRAHPIRALRVTWRDRRNHLSPNAGYPEAALAGALGIRLGGPSIYFGEVVYKPYMGDDLNQVGIEMMQKGRAVCLVASVLSLAAFVLLSTVQS